MDSYFHDLNNNITSHQNLSSILHHPDVSRDWRRQGYKYRGEHVAHKFDVSLSHVQDLLHHMYERYDTVACYSTALLNPGDIIYYINPFTLGPDQDVDSDAAAYVGGSRFQVGTKAKGRFGIVTRVIGPYIKVVPMYTFNGNGLASKAQDLHELYVDLQDPTRWYEQSVSPHRPLEVREAWCDMKGNATVQLLTTVVTLSQHILIAGNITDDSLERLLDLVRMTEG